MVFLKHFAPKEPHPTRRVPRLRLRGRSHSRPAVKKSRATSWNRRPFKGTKGGTKRKGPCGVCSRFLVFFWVNGKYANGWKRARVPVPTLQCQRTQCALRALFWALEPKVVWRCFLFAVLWLQSYSHPPRLRFASYRLSVAVNNSDWRSAQLLGIVLESFMNLNT